MSLEGLLARRDERIARAFRRETLGFVVAAIRTWNEVERLERLIFRIRLEERDPGVAA